MLMGRLYVLQVIESKANRCFYVAHAYLAAGKQLEAQALFGRAAQHAKLAVKQHQVRCVALHLCHSHYDIHCTFRCCTVQDTVAQYKTP